MVKGYPHAPNAEADLGRGEGGRPPPAPLPRSPKITEPWMLSELEWKAGGA